MSFSEDVISLVTSRLFEEIIEDEGWASLQALILTCVQARQEIRRLALLGLEHQIDVLGTGHLISCSSAALRRTQRSPSDVSELSTLGGPKTYYSLLVRRYEIPAGWRACGGRLLSYNCAAPLQRQRHLH